LTTSTICGTRGSAHWTWWSAKMKEQLWNTISGSKWMMTFKVLERMSQMLGNIIL
jgi:hypothetical protein